MISVGIIGLGTVGTGAYRILTGHNSLIKDRTGLDIKVVRVADIDTRRQRDIALKKGILTDNALDIINDKKIDIVVELIGGITPAYEYIIQSIKNKKGVITANKALLAERGREIFGLAEKYGSPIGFEASVCGGIPVIRAIRDGLVANKITSIMGILNGTSNYILTKMTEEGKSFTAALKDAQKLGFAEQDPTFDIEGIDAAHKLSILINLSFGCYVDMDSISIRGITKIEPVDIELAREFGYRIKLLALAKQEQDSLEARVEPAMIPIAHPMSNVGGVYNAVYIVGDSVGPNMYYGKGAGGAPTGSAVVSDIVDVARRMSFKEVKPKKAGFAFRNKINIKNRDETYVPYYIRFTAQDRPGVLSKISGILAKFMISISTVIQKGREENGYVPIVMLTHEAIEGDLKKAKEEIDRLPFIRGESIHIRIEEGLN